MCPKYRHIIIKDNKNELLQGRLFNHRPKYYDIFKIKKLKIKKKKKEKKNQPDPRYMVGKWNILKEKQNKKQKTKKKTLTHL